MALDAVKNFGKVTVSTGYDAAAVTIVLSGGDGAKLPDPSVSGSFNLVWWNYTDYADPTDDPNVEVVRCTARSTDTLTVTRAQESTGASTKNTAGKTYKMILGLTAKMFTDINTALTTSAGLLAMMTDETGTGALVFANTPTLVTPNIGAATGTSVNLSGTGTFGGILYASSTIQVAANASISKFYGRNDNNPATIGTESGELAILSNDSLYGTYIGVSGSTGNTWFQAMRNDSATAYDFAFQVNGGNFGIGVADPTSKFHVVGNVAITNATGDTITITTTSTSAGTIGVYSAHTGAITGTGYAGYFSKTGSSTTNIGGYFTASGATNNYALVTQSATTSPFVGIGNTAPESLLHVGVFHGDGQASRSTDKLIVDGMNLVSGGLYYGRYGQLEFYSNQNYTSIAKRYLLTNGLGGQAFAIIRSTDGNTSPSIATNGTVGSGTADLVINYRGNVGFGGITDPDIETLGTNYSPVVTIYNPTAIYPGTLVLATQSSTNASTEMGRIHFLNGTNRVAQILVTADSAANNDARMIISTMDAGSLAERITITSGGDINIVTNLKVGVNSSGTIAYTGILEVYMADNTGGSTFKINATQANLTASDVFIGFNSTSGQEGSIAGTAVAGVIAYNTFTGSHWAQSETIEAYLNTKLSSSGELVPYYTCDLEPGSVLVSTDKMSYWPGEVASHLPMCDVSEKSEDPAVYGVYGGHDKDGDILVLALGAAMVLVCDEGGKIKVGDLLCTASKPGYAKRYDGNDIRVVLGKARSSFAEKEGIIPLSLYSG